MSGTLFIEIMTFTNSLLMLKLTSHLIKNNSENSGQVIGDRRAQDLIDDEPLDGTAEGESRLKPGSISMTGVDLNLSARKEIHVQSERRKLETCLRQ